MRVFVTRDLPPPGLELLRPYCEVRLWQGDLPPPRAVLMEEIAQADGILSLLTDVIDADLIAQAPRLKVISNLAVGYDNIDVPAASARRIPVGHTPGVLTETTADCAFALLLSAARRLSEGERYVKAGQWRTWSPTALLGYDVHGATLGIIGLGRIGSAVARRAIGFQMRLLYCGGDSAVGDALGAQACSLDDLLTESDFISLHVPYKPDTHHLIGAQQLARMKSTAILINTARGGVVDNMALYHALRDRKIAHAALDVTEPEPIPPDHPLLTLDNCLIVPHIASATVATRGKMAQIAAQNLLAGLRGEKLPYCVNPEVYN